MDNNTRQKKTDSKLFNSNGDSENKINNISNNLRNIKFKSLKDRGDSVKISTKPYDASHTTIKDNDRNTNSSVQIKRDRYSNIYKSNETKYNVNSNIGFSRICDEALKNANFHVIKKNNGNFNRRVNKSSSNKQFETTSKNANLKTEVDEDTKILNTIELEDPTPKSVTKKSYTSQKTPLIKTVQNDTKRTYKTVTFAETKQKKKLNIKIPTITNDRRTKIPKLITRNHRNLIEAKNCVDNKSYIKVNKSKRKRDVCSPVCKRGGSPLTEVAKWAPNSFNELTKPYYEAWINTTLAATSKGIMKREKENIIREFKKALENRCFSPELMYENFADERFTGRIRINHK